jgi:hypothetical protein
MKGGINMKLTMLGCLVLAILVSGCSEKQSGDLNNETRDESVEINDNTVINDDAAKVEETEDNGSKRVFIDLEYLGTVEDVDLSAWYRLPYINEDTEFTWWYHSSIPEDRIISYEFNFIVPAEIDRTQKDVIVSYGRKLRYLYYEDMCDWRNAYHGRPVFEREYSHNNAYIYLIDKIRLIDNEFYDNDLWDFNEKGIIPFELPPEG